jgi:hypothetical protein
VAGISVTDLLGIGVSHGFVPLFFKTILRQTTERGPSSSPLVSAPFSRRGNSSVALPLVPAARIV